MTYNAPTHPIANTHTPELHLTQRSALNQALVKLRLEELGHTDILTQTLPPSRLQHKVSRRCLRTCGDVVHLIDG